MGAAARDFGPKESISYWAPNFPALQTTLASHERCPMGEEYCFASLHIAHGDDHKVVLHMT